jgi:uncharacterized FlgJ-related protein
MIYKFNKDSLNYERITGKTIVITLSIMIGILALAFSLIVNKLNNVRFISEETKAIILREADKENEFSKEKLKDYLTELNVKCPEIVMAQAEIESGHFTSRIFKENNNLFGMKEAGIGRPCTAKGTANNHAYYDTWKECVQDYAFYQAAYLKSIKTQEQYLQYLGENYAEDSNYVSKIRAQINLVESK